MDDDPACDEGLDLEGGPRRQPETPPADRTAQWRRVGDDCVDGLSGEPVEWHHVVVGDVFDRYPIPRREGMVPGDLENSRLA